MQLRSQVHAAPAGEDVAFERVVGLWAAGTRRVNKTAVQVDSTQQQLWRRMLVPQRGSVTEKEARQRHLRHLR